jgi:hypothetical protein
MEQALKLNRRQRRDQQFGPRYQFRGLPSSIKPDHELWCVSGHHGIGGGVLEWCFDEEDAKYMLAYMRRFPEFKNLSAGRFLDGLVRH